MPSPLVVNACAVTRKTVLYCLRDSTVRVLIFSFLARTCTELRLAELVREFQAPPLLMCMMMVPLFGKIVMDLVFRMNLLSWTEGWGLKSSVPSWRLENKGLNYHLSLSKKKAHIPHLICGRGPGMECRRILVFTVCLLERLKGSEGARTRTSQQCICGSGCWHHLASRKTRAQMFQAGRLDILPCLLASSPLPNSVCEPLSQPFDS